jgi:hypothetical protein
MLLLVAGALLGAGAVSALTERHWLLLDGSDWQRFSGAEREAWTQGFLAGHAVGRLSDSAARDTLQSAAELARQRQEGTCPPVRLACLHRAARRLLPLGESPGAPLWRGLLNVHMELRRWLTDASGYRLPRRRYRRIGPYDPKLKCVGALAALA